MRDLTERQKQMLIGVANGKPRRVIALGLGIHERTVDKHMDYLHKKINCRDVATVTRFAVAHGLVTATREEFPYPC